MSSRTRNIAVAVLALMAGLALTTASARPSGSAWTPVKKSGLTVTEGTITAAGKKALLRTEDAGMRATAEDGGRHARSARLRFRYLGESPVTEPLGSGLIRRQVGLKVNSQDPCNLVYVMWHQFPENKIQVQIKRNPGQTTSTECGNAGYTTLADIPVAAGDSLADHGPHQLEVRSRRDALGDLIVSVLADGVLVREVVAPSDLSSGLEGPIGVRSDNGIYVFRLSAKRRG